MKHPRIHSTCPHDCPSACALEVEKVDANTIGRIYGAKGNSYTDGVICAKVANYQERIHHPQRLLKPLRRNGAKGDGRSAFQEISWESALDAVAEGLLKAEQRYGAEAIWPYYYAGTMGLIQRDGINRLRHCKGYSGQHSTICSSAAGAGWDAGVGAMRGVDAREIEHSDLVVLWGCNAVHTQINLMHHTTRSRKQNGAQVVVIDPYRTATADKADVHLMLRPGTDGALACAVMHVLFNENYADRDYLRKYTDVPEELEAHLKTKTPAWAATITGLSTAEIINFAHLYGRSKASFIRASYGFTRTRNGATNMHAVSCLPAITGAWQYKGGGALYSNSGLSNVNTNLIEGLDEINPATRILDQSRIGPILTGDKSDLGDGPPVNALFIQNTNPLVVMPASGQVRKGFMRDDLFVCVHEQFMTETATFADIVLPATMFLEHSDLYRAGGHTFLQFTQPIVTAPGECRSNHQVLNGLAQRLGLTHPAFEMSELELAEATLKASGLPCVENMAKNHWHDCATDFESMHFLTGFGHADGRFHFKPEWATFNQSSDELPVFPDHYNNIDEANIEKPFRLVAAPARWFLNTTFTETRSSQKRERRPTAMLHPDDAEQYAICEGQIVSIGNDQATVRLHATVSEKIQPGVIVVESIWPNEAFIDGCGINHLISADAAAPYGGAVIHDTAVWIKVSDDPAISTH